MTQQHILQVSELTKKVRFILESELHTVWLCGEISNFIAANSGHWYLSLKDSKSQVKCAMFKGSNRKVRISPRNGQQVLVRAKVSLYEPRGDFQLIIEQMDDAGEGLLRQQFDLLKNKLNAQGIFANHHKQVMPVSINTVGIVTSPTGAAVKDIIAVLKRRNPLIRAIVYPALVQGELAKADIVSALNLANQRNECDVLIVGRGGGSLEDLWSFNEEAVVMAVYQSRIPTISAVGHEIDNTLTDYAADLRAPTPSAAAELVSGDISEIGQKTTTLTKRLQLSIERLLNDNKLKQQALIHRFKQTHPEQKLQLNQQKSDELCMRLNNAIIAKLSTAKQKPLQLGSALKLLSPLARIKNYQEENKQLQARLNLVVKQILQNKTEKFVHAIDQLNIVSPLATLSRGYSVARSKDGSIIRTLEQVQVGENIEIEVSNGIIETKVINK